MMSKVMASRGRDVAPGGECGYEALQSMMTGEYTEESTGARTIRQTGGKDRHSKVFTSKGPRDRRVRLSVATAIRFYDLQDRLGFEQPSKAVEWLLLHCQSSIQALPQLGALQSVRNAAIPRHVYSDHPPPQNLHKEPKSCYEHITHEHKGEEYHHYNRGYQILHSPAPYESHVQDSIEEDPPQSSNPSSSGASSDHPIHLPEVTWPICKALTEAVSVMPARMASAAGVRRRHSSSTTSSHMNKRNRMLQNPAYSSAHHHTQADNYATFTENAGGDGATGATSLDEHHSNCSLPAAGRIMAINYNDIAPINYSSFNNNSNITSLFINDNNAMLMNNSLQAQLNDAAMRVQPNIIRETSSNDTNQYVQMTQLLFSGQANQLANEALVTQNVIQGPCNNSLMDRAARAARDRACTSNNLSDSIHHLYKQAGLQHVEELVNNMYASPSPSESTSINTLAAAYSKAGTTTVANDQVTDLLYRPGWSTLSSDLKQENLHHSLL
eukprot:c15043_g1_i1 orf=648-2141(+)